MLARCDSIRFQGAVTTGTTPVGTPTNVEGYTLVGFQIVGLTVGTIQFEATLSQEPTTVTWVAVRATNANDGVAGTTAAADGLFTLDVRAFAAVRARVATLAWVTDGALNIYGFKQTEV